MRVFRRAIGFMAWSVAAFAYASDINWRQTGPTGASGISDLVVDAAGVVYAGSPEGVFRSTDGGDSWSPVNAGLSGGVTSLAAAPGVPGRIYAALQTVSPNVLTFLLYRTTDGGDHWSLVSGPPAGNPVHSIAIDPRGTVYLATDGAGVLRSFDGVTSWIPVNAGLSSTVVSSVAVDAQSPSTVYAVAGTVFKTTSSGNAWSAAPIPANEPNGVLAISPLGGPILYYGSFIAIDARSLGHMFRTTDGAASWSLANNGLTNNGILSIAVDPSSPVRAYTAANGDPLSGVAGGIFRTVDAGGSWTRVSDGLPNFGITRVALDPTSAAIYAGANDGVVFKAFAASTEETLSLLGGRFLVTLNAVDPRTGLGARGRANAGGDRYGYFALPDFTGDPLFPEVIVKMADATGAPPPFGGAFWFFYAPLTDVNYTLTVADTVRGTTRTYTNLASSPGELCGGVDTNAFRP